MGGGDADSSCSDAGGRGAHQGTVHRHACQLDQSWRVFSSAFHVHNHSTRMFGVHVSVAPVLPACAAFAFPSGPPPQQLREQYQVQYAPVGMAQAAQMRVLKMARCC